jgi:hypothetical protein
MGPLSSFADVYMMREAVTIAAVAINNKPRRKRR